MIREEGLAKTVLQGTVRGGRKRRRQKKRWEDNIAERTGLKLSEAIRHAEDREYGENWFIGHVQHPNSNRHGIDEMSRHSRDSTGLQAK